MPAAIIRIHRTGGAEHSREFPVAAATAIPDGAPVVLTSGLLVEASANPRNIIGFARSVHPFVPAGATDQTSMPISPALASMAVTYIGTLSDTALTRVLAATDVGAFYGITKTGSRWHLDSAKTTAGTNTVAMVLRLIDPVGASPADTPSPTNSGLALVEFCLLNEATATGTAAA